MPHIPRKPRTLTAHGHRRVDDWYWLRDRDDPAVAAVLEAENRHAEHRLAPVAALRRQLETEMRSRLRPDEDSVPYRHGDYWYYSRFRPGADYPLHCRRPADGGGEQILLDVEALAAGHDYFDLSHFEPSPDHRRLAYAVDTTGDRRYSIHCLDLDSAGSASAIDDVTDDFVWAADSRTLFYVNQEPGTLRDFQLWRRACDDKDATLVWQENREDCWLGVARSLSGQFLYLTSSSTLSTEVRFWPADDTSGDLHLFRALEEGHEYYVTDGGDRFYVLTNDAGRNFRVCSCPLDDLRPAAWQEIVAHRDDVLIHDLEAFERYLVLSVAERGLDGIEILQRESGRRASVAFEAKVYTAAPTDNYDYRSETLRYAVESTVDPETVIDRDLASGTQRIVRRERLPGGFDRRHYATERRHFSARDGTQVPVSLVWRRDCRRTPATPLLIDGYGAYGISADPVFDPDLACLLDRGWLYAIAHVRGGSELGRDWYEAGRRKSKMNTFLDFIDVTRALHAARLSSPPHSYAIGGSAGGLLVAAVANFAPGLYNGIVAHAPFVDVVTSMLDESLPLTTGEYDEWGDPRRRDDYLYMLGYSPYDNVREQPYPGILATTALHDSQVPYWEAAKWVAKLRALRSDGGPTLLRTEMHAGHSGRTGRYRCLEDTAIDFAFLLMLEQRTIEA
ncbi:MAG: S9 family peptidase [Woeseiaceae bacterium]|nr:S9 family peptidase [Woeseiaceae bacterium]